MTVRAAIVRAFAVACGCALTGCSALTGFSDLVFDDPSDMGRADARDRSEAGSGEGGRLDADDHEDATVEDGGAPLDGGLDARSDDGGNDAADGAIEGGAPDAAAPDASSVDCTSGADCDDGNACTTIDCVAGRCTVTREIECSGVPTGPCDDGLVCEPTTGACVPMPRPVGASCTPSDPCTYEPACTSDGQCVGDTTCAVFDDGNPCTTAICTMMGCVQEPRTGGSCDGGMLGTCCAGRCVDLTSDAENCGTCLNECAAGLRCNMGSCAACTLDLECDDGLACTVDDCDPADFSCANVRRAATCIIDGVCYDANARNPANTCERCTPAESATEWTSHTDTCDDGLFCTVGDRCRSDGHCTGTPRSCPGDGCNVGVCLESADRCDATPLPDRKPCGIGLVDQCCGGVCVFRIPGC